MVTFHNIAGHNYYYSVNFYTATYTFDPPPLVSHINVSMNRIIDRNLCSMLYLEHIIMTDINSWFCIVVETLLASQALPPPPLTSLKVIYEQPLN